MSNKTPGGPQDATGAAETYTLPEGREGEEDSLVAYLEAHAAKLSEWQHLVFNASHNHSNRMGLANTANEIQFAAYELRIILGYTVIQAKLGSKIPLTSQEQQEVDDQHEAERRARSVESFKEGLHGGPVSYQFPEGRRSARRR